MIDARDLTKRFGDVTALDHVSCHIERGSIYGMVGSNGAGKSTFLRILSGIYRADEGELHIDGEEVWENPEVKGRLLFVPDELYFLDGANIRRMAKLYASIYPNFDGERFQMLLNALHLPERRTCSSFSKGMRRQAAAALALSVRAEFLLFDETFDGLDPVMRKYVKSLICSDVAERNTTVIIASHSLRELEDICDQLVLLHKGGIVLESDTAWLKTSLFRVQIALPGNYGRDAFGEIPGILEFKKNGSVTNMILRGDMELVRQKLQEMHPLILDMLPLTLEEVFIYELQSLGYHAGDLLGEESDDER